MKTFTILVIFLTPILAFFLFQEQAKISEQDYYATRIFPTNEAHPCATEVRFLVASASLEFAGELIDTGRQNLTNAIRNLEENYNCSWILTDQEVF